LFFAECSTNGIHVFGGVFGGDVLEHFGVALDALVDEFLCEIDHLLFRSRVIGR
jgi:hypothetical protein